MPTAARATNAEQRLDGESAEKDAYL